MKNEVLQILQRISCTHLPQTDRQTDSEKFNLFLTFDDVRELQVVPMTLITHFPVLYVEDRDVLLLIVLQNSQLIS